MKTSFKLKSVAGALLCCALLGVAHADDDPPGRVLRLRQIEGSASFVPAGSNDWAEAYANRPLVSGDRLRVESGARAALQVGPNSMHLAARTELALSLLNDQVQRYQLNQGTLEIRIRDRDDDLIQIDTPNLSFMPRTPGRYRLDVDAREQTTSVTILDGAGEVTGGGTRREMRGRQQIRFEGRALETLFVGDAPFRDDFQQWAEAREASDDRAASVARYVPAGVTGYEDLEGHGVWEQDGQYGSVWVPRVTIADWAPYRYGRWIWVAPWGWTWCDDAPWGFAPFHYGRWVSLRGRWGWVPGPVGTRAVYSPAMVAFVGGGGLSVSVGKPVAWLPLAPGEPWRPWFRSSQNYIVRVNKTIVIDRDHHHDGHDWRNRHVDGAITVVDGNHFSHGRPVQGGLLPIDYRKIGVIKGIEQPPVKPTDESRYGGGFQRPRDDDRHWGRPGISVRPPEVAGPRDREPQQGGRDDPRRPVPPRETRLPGTQDNQGPGTLTPPVPRLPDDHPVGNVWRERPSELIKREGQQPPSLRNDREPVVRPPETRPGTPPAGGEQNVTVPPQGPREQRWRNHPVETPVVNPPPVSPRNDQFTPPPENRERDRRWNERPVEVQPPRMGPPPEREREVQRPPLFNPPVMRPPEVRQPEVRPPMEVQPPRREEPRLEPRHEERKIEPRREEPRREERKEERKVEREQREDRRNQ